MGMPQDDMENEADLVFFVRMIQYNVCGPRGRQASICHFNMPIASCHIIRYVKLGFKKQANFIACKCASWPSHGFTVASHVLLPQQPAAQHVGCQAPNSGQERPLLLLPPKSVEVCRVPLESSDRGLEIKISLPDWVD